MTNTFSKKVSTGATRLWVAATNSPMVGVPSSAPATSPYAAHRARSSSQSKRAGSTSHAVSTSLPLMMRTARARLESTASKSSPSAAPLSSSAVRAARAGLFPRSASTARTCSTLTPLSTRYTCSRPCTKATTPSLASSGTGIGSSEAAASTAAARSTSMSFSTRVPTRPSAARRRPKGSALAVGAQPAANSPTSESRRSAALSSAPASVRGRSSPAERGSTNSNTASETAPGRPCCSA
mmetsp:Transcript_8599/g.28150  ORF Transcript_8599/g.28150 Transcript_8599/m.28150 type:complete len:239 (-) Transcript_8599:525-1241(-)